MKCICVKSANKTKPKNPFSHLYSIHNSPRCVCFYCCCCVDVCGGKRKKNAKTHWETNKSVKQQDKNIYTYIWIYVYKQKKKQGKNYKAKETKQKIIKTIWNLCAYFISFGFAFSNALASCSFLLRTDERSTKCSPKGGVEREGEKETVGLEEAS